MAFGFRSFLGELKPTSEPIIHWWSRSQLEGLCMHKSHQAMKYLSSSAASHMVQWGNAALHHQSYNRLTKCIKDDMVHHESWTPLLDSETHPSYWWPWSGKKRRTLPQNLSFWSLETSRTQVHSNKSDNKSGKGSPIPSRTQQPGSTRQGPLLTKKSTTPDFLQNSGKTES